MRMEYLEAERTLAQAERQAWDARDWDALSRLYMPLQEARRQKRQRCGEGVVRLDLIAAYPDDALDALTIVRENPHGQLLVAGWGSLDTALSIRTLASEQKLFLDTFLGAVYPTCEGRVVAIIPRADAEMLVLPETSSPSLDELTRMLPPDSIVLRDEEIPRGPRPGTYETYGEIMALWERLHTPFLARANAQADPLLKMAGYRATIEVDYACELAHQKLSDVARKMMKG